MKPRMFGDQPVSGKKLGMLMPLKPGNLPQTFLRCVSTLIAFQAYICSTILRFSMAMEKSTQVPLKRSISFLIKAMAASSLRAKHIQRGVFD